MVRTCHNKWSFVLLAIALVASTAGHGRRPYYRHSYSSYFRPSYHLPWGFQWGYQSPFQWWNPQPATEATPTTTPAAEPTIAASETTEGYASTSASETTAASATTAASGTPAVSGSTAASGTPAAPGTTAASEITAASVTPAAPGTTAAQKTTAASGATVAAGKTDVTVATAAADSTAAPGTTAEPVTTSAAPTTTPTTTTTTQAPLMPGLHPTGSHSCAVNEIPMGAYQVQQQMPDGSVQMYHYLVCSAASSTFRGPLVGVATTRAASCPGEAPLYAGFNAGKGPCAPLAAGWKMTTTCKNGDNQGPLPAAVPANHIRYIGCLGIPGDTDYALTQYSTSNSGFREELQAVKCCKVVPA